LSGESSTRMVVSAECFCGESDRVESRWSADHGFARSLVVCDLRSGLYICNEIKYKEKEELTVSVFVKSEGIPSPNGHQLLLPLPKTLVHHISNAVRLCRAPDHRIEPRPRGRVEQIITERREARPGEDLAEWSWSGVVGVLVIILAVRAAEDEGSLKI